MAIIMSCLVRSHIIRASDAVSLAIDLRFVTSQRAFRLKPDRPPAVSPPIAQQGPMRGSKMMRPIMQVSVAILGLTLGPALAESEGRAGTEPNTAFTSVPGVVSIASVQAISQAQMEQDRAYAAVQPHPWQFPA
jgi:hypothetical protein